MRWLDGITDSMDVSGSPEAALWTELPVLRDTEEWFQGKGQRKAGGGRDVVVGGRAGLKECGLSRRLITVDLPHAPCPGC